MVQRWMVVAAISAAWLTGVRAQAVAECPIAPADPLWFVDNGIAEVVFDRWDGQMFVDDEFQELTTIEVASSSGIFTGECEGMDSPFDICNPRKIFKLDASGISGGDFWAGFDAPEADLEFLESDLTIGGSGRGTDLVCLRPVSVADSLEAWPAVEGIDWFTGLARAGITDPVVRLVLDLDQDYDVDLKDRRIYVKDVVQAIFGDANLDLEFNSSDLVEVFRAGQYEDTVALNSTWATGDWDGDGDFTSGDFVVAFQDGQYELGPRAHMAVVPEPHSLLILVAGLGGTLRRMRRRHARVFLSKPARCRARLAG